MIGAGGRLHGKVAIVTGAAAGIGRATAVRFASEGAQLVVNDVDATRLERLAAQVRGEFGAEPTRPSATCRRSPTRSGSSTSR
jgi:NAD(P)-dependent dehydrogenase (short-subunit alcohol dehydrogenase family)